jgi:hypothetical protein
MKKVEKYPCDECTHRGSVNWNRDTSPCYACMSNDSSKKPSGFKRKKRVPSNAEKFILKIK